MWVDWSERSGKLLNSMAKLLCCCPENGFTSAAQPRLVNPEVTLSPLKFIPYVSLRLLFYIFRIQSQYLPVGFLAGTIWTSLVGAAMFFLSQTWHMWAAGRRNQSSAGRWVERSRTPMQSMLLNGTGTCGPHNWLTTVYYDTSLQVKVSIGCSGKNEIILWSETSYTALFIHSLKWCTH